MNRSELFGAIRRKQSFLCVGLDPVLDRIPAHLHGEDDPIFAFNRAIIDATQDFCVAYKPNLAFYEAQGAAGWESFRKTIDYIPEDQLIIADAKRGDIGNTAKQYAKTFFETYPCDAVTVAPYMGRDSVEPFLSFPNKWSVMLALTSNPGSADLQQQLAQDGRPLFEHLVEQAVTWGTPDQLMFVVGATRGEAIARMRALAPEYFFLAPGVGAQGGSLQEVARLGLNDHAGLLVNSSRGILYASSGTDFAEAAGREAKKLQTEMAALLKEADLL